MRLLGEIGPSDGRVGAPKKPSAFQKFFMAEKLSNYIRKRRNRSSTSSGGETSPFQEAKKPRDLTETEDESTGSDHETNDEVEEIFSLGRRLDGTDFQMFRDLPLEIIKRRKDQMAVFKQANDKV